MLVYVEQYKFEDISKRWGLRDGKIVVSQLQGVVQKEMLLITALDSAIGTVTDTLQISRARLTWATAIC